VNWGRNLVGGLGHRPDNTTLSPDKGTAGLSPTIQLQNA